ncbi:hypothetical protein V7024_06260 [Bacillus sp. JJ864]|uniref:hypothetical protein n=1 Tax=Bacillus sp. JJ864 TaxID=3122975 RepID=UPI002FFFBD9C
METKEKRRKVRSDKKREIKPSVPLKLYECISQISYVLDKPMKQVAEELCKEGLNSGKVIDDLSVYFTRDYWKDQYTLIRGFSENERYDIYDGVIKKRVSIRFEQPTYNRLSALSFALDLTTSSGTALLLKTAISDPSIMETYFMKYLSDELDSRRIQQLKYILNYISEENDLDIEFDINTFIAYMIDQTKKKTVRLKDGIVKFLDEWVTS